MHFVGLSENGIRLFWQHFIDITFEIIKDLLWLIKNLGFSYEGWWWICILDLALDVLFGCCLYSWSTTIRRYCICVLELNFVDEGSAACEHHETASGSDQYFPIVQEGRHIHKI